MKRKTSFKTISIASNRFNASNLDVYTLPLDVLIVGGGGGGGYYAGGGGAGGFLLLNKIDMPSTTDVSNVIVGSGGTAGIINSVGGNGGNSLVFGFIAYGGGGGGGGSDTGPGSGNLSGNPGGSGEKEPVYMLPVEANL